MDRSTRKAKLESVIATLVILKPRLTETFRRDVAACIKMVEEVVEDLKPAEEPRPLGDLMAEEDQRRLDKVKAEKLSKAKGITYLEHPNTLAEWGLGVFFDSQLVGYIEHAPDADGFQTGKSGFRYTPNTHGGRHVTHGETFETIDQVKISIAGDGKEDESDTENHS